MSTTQPIVTLNDGHRMPQFGLGVWQTPAEDTAAVVEQALAMGYRLIDTANGYRNEVGVGEAIRASGLPRREIFVTTKIVSMGYDAALKAMDEGLGKLKLDYVDLYLIHWPAPMRNQYMDTYRAMLKLRDEGRIRSVGVSNFTEAHLERVMAETGVAPTVNQVELHPTFQQQALRAFDASHKIATESWSPLGRGLAFDHPVVKALARKHGKTPAQVVIRWHLDSGLIVIPKTVSKARLAENLAVFDFALDAEDMKSFATLDANGRFGPHPDEANF